MPIMKQPLFQAALALLVTLCLLVQNFAFASAAVHHQKAPTPAVFSLDPADVDCPHPGGADTPRKPCEQLPSCHTPCSMQALPSGFGLTLAPSPTLYDASEATRPTAFILERPQRPPLV